MSKMPSGQAFEILVRKLVSLIDNSPPAVEHVTDGRPPSSLNSTHKLTDQRDQIAIWLALRSIGFEGNQQLGFDKPLDDQIAMFHDTDHFEQERAAKLAINNEVIALGHELLRRLRTLVGHLALGETEQLETALKGLYFSIQQDIAQRQDMITPKPARSHPRVPRNESPRVPQPDEQWGDPEQSSDLQ